MQHKGEFVAYFKRVGEAFCELELDGLVWIRAILLTESRATLGSQTLKTSMASFWHAEQWLKV